MAEAIVVFNPALAEALDYRAKRAGQVVSKGRIISAQFEGYFADDHWYANARHANRMAKLLSEGLSGIPGVRLGWPTQANEVFPIVPKAIDQALKAAGAQYHAWTDVSLPADERVGSDEALIRLVASFATTEAEVRQVVDIARSALSRQAAE
jgi:threonine aldolase